MQYMCTINEKVLKNLTESSAFVIILIGNIYYISKYRCNIHQKKFTNISVKRQMIL